jgi:hypothetical protein
VVTGQTVGAEVALELVRFAPKGPDADADQDGLGDGTEILLGTDPYAVDTDGDGLSDGDGVLVHGTDPTRRDTDSDGLSDREELRWGSNPLDPLDTAVVPVGALTILCAGLILSWVGWRATRRHGVRGMHSWKQTC